MGKWLEDSGYNVHYINALDYGDTEIAAGTRAVRTPRRNANGTGKFIRGVVPLPAALSGLKKRYARYGISKKDLENRIRRHRPDIVLVSTGMTYWYPGVQEAVEFVREAWPYVPVVAGGIYASLLPDHCREKCGVNAVVTGDDFTEFQSLADSSGLPSLCIGTEYKTLYDPTIWRDAAVLRLNRGCPFRCDYCASGVLCDRFHIGNAARLFAQLKSYHQACGTRNFAFYDDALLSNKERAFLPFLEMVVESGLKIKLYLPNAVHMRNIDSKTADLMKKAGFREVRMGFESASESFHSNYGDKLSVNDLENAVDALRTAGFASKSIIVYVMAGLPGQQVEEIEHTVRFAASFGISVSVAEFSPVPGTSLWPECIKRSEFPLAEEPLFHNSSLFPLRNEIFSVEKMQEIKSRVTEINRRVL